MVAQPLCLLTVHAHPDDESSKGAGTVARYHAEGCAPCSCAAPAARRATSSTRRWTSPRSRPTSPAVRRAELDKAAAIIGYDEVEMLGYRDSGMPDSEANANPLSFAQAPMDEAVGRLVRDHPPHAAAGDPHLRRRAGRLPAPRPHQGARHHPAGRRPGRRPRLVPGGGRAVAGVEDLLLGLVAEAHRADAREVPRARTSSRPSARTGSSVRPRTTASPRRSTSRASPRCASRRSSPTPPRSTPSRRSGSACRARSPAGSTPTTTTSAPRAWSTRRRPEDDLFAGLRAEVNA